MINHSDTQQTIYDINNPFYWDRNSFNQELDRVYDICIGCRLCFNLCPSFPALFDAVDYAGDEKRLQAIEEGKISVPNTKEDYMNLPEGEHAIEASAEVEFRGEISDLTTAQRWEVIDLCYQCKLCDSVCPYTPGQEHEFQLDFPKLMIRAQAIRTKEHGIKTNDKFLSNTDFVIAIGSIFGPLLNVANRIGIIRFFMEKMIGIHRKRILPKFQSSTFQKWFTVHLLLPNPLIK